MRPKVKNNSELESENESIGEYIALYRFQRTQIQQRIAEKDAALLQLQQQNTQLTEMFTDALPVSIVSLNLALNRLVRLTNRISRLQQLGTLRLDHNPFEELPEDSLLRTMAPRTPVLVTAAAIAAGAAGFTPGGCGPVVVAATGQLAAGQMRRKGRSRRPSDPLSDARPFVIDAKTARFVHYVLLQPHRPIFYASTLSGLAFVTWKRENGSTYTALIATAALAAGGAAFAIWWIWSRRGGCDGPNAGGNGPNGGCEVPNRDGGGRNGGGTKDDEGGEEPPSFRSTTRCQIRRKK
ncbi:hypothetical protein niasHT_010137 [Heterodera trifolii]|uniref:Uncharacterized protein n=1 Tax=Heterodera trifolii TaxID=157864 RepID=A0ABD2LWF2_9BILA